MERPIRVLHAVVNMNRGGAETLIMNVYRNIDRSQVQFDFLTCKEGVFDREIEEMGGAVHRIPYVTDTGHFGYQNELRRFFSVHATYPIVHSHMDKMSGFVLRAAKRAGVPIRIAHSHNTSSEGGFAAKLYKWYAGQYILPSATHLLACSQAAASWLFTHSTVRVSIVKNGIDCEKFAFSQDIRNRTRLEFGIAEDCFVIGHVGRFNEQKNHVFLLSLFADVVKSRPNALLLLVGDGPLRAATEQQAASLGLQERVRFLGVRSNVHHFMQAFDVFVFPSLHEGLPVTLVEAQAAGLPCIVSSAITSEADMGAGLIEFTSLASGTGVWVDRILAANRRGQDAAAYAKENGYNIHETAMMLQETYAAIALAK